MPATVESSHPASYDMSDSLGVLRHYWWLLVLGTVLGLGAGGAWWQLQDPIWESTTSVLVHPAGHDTNVIGGRTQGQVNLDTEAQLVRSTATATGAADHLGGATAPDELARQVTVEVPPNTSVLQITFTAATPEQARAGSAAFAETYLAHREQTARATLANQMAAIEGKVEELDASLAEINDQLAATTADTSAEANLESQRSTLASQLSSLNGRLNELTTATVTPGDIISEARVPTDPAGTPAPIILASGAALGLVGGLTAAGLTERFARRVRRPADVTRRLGVPMLAVLSGRPRGAAHGEEILSPYGTGGRVVDRLRNEVLASTQGQVILVTSARGGAGSSLVAGNLAASLSRSGRDVIVVGARVPDNVAAAGPLTRLLGVADTPGLSEVLAGRVAATDALQRAPRHPRLRAMTMGGSASATGLLQQPSLREVLRTLTAQTEYVVVDAPPTTASADTQSLAGHADVALLVVEPRRSRLADVADAAAQLRRVGTPLLGAVMVPPQHPEAAQDAEQPAAGPPDAAAGERDDAGSPAAGADHPDHPDYPDRPDFGPGDARAPRSGPPRPMRTGPHLPVLGAGEGDSETVVMPRLDADAMAVLEGTQGSTEQTG